MPSTITLAERIWIETGQDIQACRQSAACADCCPLAEYFDWTPTRIVEAVQSGEAGLALETRTLWLCASCISCATTCPTGLDQAQMMGALAGVARERGIRPKVLETGLRRKVFLRGADLPARSRELGLIPGARPPVRRWLEPGEVLTTAALAVFAPLMTLGSLAGTLFYHVERRFQEQRRHNETKGD